MYKTFLWAHTQSIDSITMIFTIRLRRRYPLFHLRHAMATRAHPLVKCDRCPIGQHPLQHRLIRRHGCILGHLEQYQRPHVRHHRTQPRRVRQLGHHLQELACQSGIRIQLNVAGQHKVRHGRIACDIPADVHRIEQRVGAAVGGRLLGAVGQAGIRRRPATVEPVARDHGGIRDGWRHVLLREVDVKGGVLADELAVGAAVAHVPDGVERAIEIGAGREEGDADGRLPSGLGGRGESLVHFTKLHMITSRIAYCYLSTCISQRKIPYLIRKLAYSLAVYVYQ